MGEKFIGMTKHNIRHLDYNTQAVLQEMLAHIIPGNELLPSAGDLDSKQFIGREMGSDSETNNAVRIIIDLLESRSQQIFEQPFIDCNKHQQIEILKLVESAHEDLFNVVITLIYSFYYTHPKVLVSLKPGLNSPQPEGYPMEIGLIELRKAVEERGPLYRDS